jgi:hypothetical protein
MFQRPSVFSLATRQSWTAGVDIVTPKTSIVPAQSNAVSKTALHSLPLLSRQFTRIGHSVRLLPAGFASAHSALLRTSEGQLVSRTGQEGKKVSRKNTREPFGMAGPSIRTVAGPSIWARQRTVAALKTASPQSLQEQFGSVLRRQPYAGSRLVSASAPEVPYASTAWSPALRRGLPQNRALPMVPSVAFPEATQQKSSHSLDQFSEPVRSFIPLQRGEVRRAARRDGQSPKQSGQALSKAVPQQETALRNARVTSWFNQPGIPRSLRWRRVTHFVASPVVKAENEILPALQPRRANPVSTLLRPDAQVFSSLPISRRPAFPAAQLQPALLPALAPRLKQTDENSSSFVASAVRPAAITFGATRASSVPRGRTQPPEQPTAAPASLTHLRAAPAAVRQPAIGTSITDRSELNETQRNAARSAVAAGGGAEQLPAQRALQMVSPQQLQTISQRVYEIIVDRVRREKERSGR